MYSDLLETIDNNLVSFVMVDLSAAFDTIDTSILIRLLKNGFGITGTPLKCFESYLTNQTMNVLIENSASDTEFLKCWGSSGFMCLSGANYNVYSSAVSRG
jgi:hypothetical protein